MSLHQMSPMGILLTAFALISACTGPGADTEALLYPVCEPSAALPVPCATNGRRCLLVSDDDVANELFLYPVAGAKLDVASRRRLKMGRYAVDDIEALVDMGAGRVLVVGSHSRKKNCAVVPERQRLLPLGLDGGELRPTGEMLQSFGITRELFTRDGEAGPRGLLTAIWSAVEQGDARAESAHRAHDVGACDAAGSLDVEGAVAIPGRSGRVEVWLGLRKPQVELDGERWSVLLRLEGLNRIRFDRAALLDLEGRGIRELALDGDWLWGIAAGPEDHRKNFVLWRVPVRDIRPDARLRAELFRELPTGAEGLAVAGGLLYVFIDGNGGRDWAAMTCGEDGAYLSLPRP